MMEKDNSIDKYDMMPFIALIHNISKNRLNYSLKNPKSDMAYESRYLIEIHKRKNLSQEDLANIFGQSKGTIAKALRKLEDKDYVERIVDKNNRRKYKIKTTEKGEKLAVLLKEDLEEWEDKVGISELDEKTIEQLKEITRKSEEILKE